MSGAVETDAPDSAEAFVPPLPTFYLRTDAAGVVTGMVHSNAPQDGMTEVSAEVYAAAVLGLTTFDGAAVHPYTPPPPPPPPRRAALATLLDPLSAAQRGAITLDHWMRLQADAARTPDGTVFVGSSKVARAAADMGLAPSDWFTLAGA